jgi:hypothetical protein
LGKFGTTYAFPTHPWWWRVIGMIACKPRCLAGQNEPQTRNDNTLSFLLVQVPLGDAERLGGFGGG